MTLETPRLLLRSFEEADAPDLFDYARDPRVGPMAGWPVHENVEKSLEVIRSCFGKAPYDFALVDKQSGKVIGSGGLCDRHYDWLPGKDDEIGYVLHPDFWGRGLVPEAMAEVIRFGFSELGLDHIWCGHFLGNHNSRRVQEKLGFVPYGEPMERDVPALKEKRMEQFSLLTRQDWQLRQSAADGAGR